MSLKSSIAFGLAPVSRALSRVAVPDTEELRLGWRWALPPEHMEFPHAYRLIPSIYFCVSLIQEALAATPLRFYQGRGESRVEIERAPLNVVELWQAANEYETGYDLVEQMAGGLGIHGNTFLFKDYMGTDRVQELWVLPGHLVNPVPGRNRTIVRYDVMVGLGRFVEVPPQQIVHVKRYDPEHGLVGLSPLKVAQLAYLTQRDAARFLRTFYQRGGTVAGHYSTEHAIDDNDARRIKEDLTQRYAGPEHAWEPVILPRKLKYERAGLTLDEMQFIENNKLTEDQIFQIFKIPPIIGGRAEGAGGLNSDASRVAQIMLVRHALQPTATKISNALDERLLKDPAFGREVTCEFDFSGNPALQQSRLDQAKTYKEVVGLPIMSPAEARREFGLDDMQLEELDQIWVPLGVEPIESALAEPDPEPAPEADPDQEPKFSVARRRSRAALRKRADATLATYERRSLSAYRRFFNAQERRAVAKLRTQWDGRGAALEAQLRVLDAEDLLADPKSHDVTLIRRLIRGIVADRGAQALAELGLALAFDSQATEVADWVRSHVSRAVNLPNDVTKQMLREAIAEGLESGDDLNQIVARVRGVFDDRRDNAVTIARTETAPAYNFASVKAYDQSGVVEAKEWLTAGDETVREWHRLAEGQVVPLNASFSVGPDMLEYPGDPSGDPSNTINCRCTVVPVVSTIEPEGQEALPGPIASRLKPPDPRAPKQTIEEFLLNGHARR